MKTNDTLLYQMIENDLKHKNSVCPLLVDVLVKEPKEIEVKDNEAVYVHFFYKSTEEDFVMDLVSPSGMFRYDNDCLIDGSCNVITRHFGNIKITGELPSKYFVQYVKVKF